MGKHEPMTAKAIGIKIKSKGLQKLKHYCEMCKKQCRDDNGFKCHIQSEAHQRQALIVCEDTNQFVSQFSKEFMDGFLYILKTRYRSKKILANTVYQEYIKERDHVHMNATRWLNLTEFAEWLGEEGYTKTEDSERGALITYIDNDPETLKRRELEKINEKRRLENKERVNKEIQEQMERSKKDIDRCKRKNEAEPIDFVEIDKNIPSCSSDKSIKDDLDTEKLSSPDDEVKIPVFNVQPFTIKSTKQTNFKPIVKKKRKLNG